MKNFAKRVSALVLALVVGAAALCPAAFAAASLPDLPRDQCVVDDANVLSDSTTQTIIDLNNQLQSSCNGAQIGVLTVDYTGNYSTEDYATQAFNAWGIGDATNNNGVLILLVMESPIYEDGDYYVTYGDGFRNTTLESQASAIAQTMENDFAACDYDGAVTTCANNVAGCSVHPSAMQWAGTGAPSHGATWQARPAVGIIVPARRLLRAPVSVPDTARAMAPAPAMTGPARPGTTTGVRPVLPWAAALAAVPLGAARSVAAASAAGLSVEWAAAPAMAAAVDADGNALRAALGRFSGRII